MVTESERNLHLANGWYLYPDYICALADHKVNTEGWEAGVSYIVDVIYDTDKNDENYQKFVDKKR